MKALLFLAVIPLSAQQVTISQQPGQTVIATLGAQLTAVSIYSAEVCSLPGVTVSSSWGTVRQIAEANGINVIDPALSPATAQRAESKTKTHKAVQIAGVLGLATLFAAVFHAPPPWLIEGAAALTGGAQVLGTYLATGEAQRQATIQAALAALIDPSSIFSISNGACVNSRLMLGQTVNNFKPIVATMPAASVSPNLRREEVPAPNSAVPGAFSTHPAINDCQEVTGWDAEIEYVAFAR